MSILMIRALRWIMALEFLGHVVIEPAVHAETRAQRGAEIMPERVVAPTRVNLGRLQPDAARVWPLIDDDVELEVLHGRVEVFLDRRLEPVDFVDKEHVAAFERGEQAREIAGLFRWWGRWCS